MRSPPMPPPQMMTTIAHSSLPTTAGVYLATNGIFKDNTNVSDCRYINAIACIRKTADAFKDGLTYYEFAQTIKSVELSANIPAMSVDLSSCSIAANPLPIITSLDTRGSCVSIADSLGQLLFYANTRAATAGKSRRKDEQLEALPPLPGHLLLLNNPPFPQVH